MDLLRRHPNGWVIKIYVQPRSAKNSIVGLHGNALKIKLTAPPVDGEANRMCIRFLSKSFGLSKASLEIISGHASRNKKVLVHDDSPEALKKLRNRIQVWINADRGPSTNQG